MSVKKHARFGREVFVKHETLAGVGVLTKRGKMIGVLSEPVWIYVNIYIYTHPS